VIGAGTFAEQCHLPGVQAHPQGVVAALCGRTRERVTSMAQRWRVPDVYTDYHELLARPDIDAVTVTTPDAMHLPITVAALAAGKHVFCEKPLAMNPAEAQQMVEAAERSGLVGMVAFTFRYTRALPALRRLLQEGAIGAPFYVNLQVHWGGIISPQDTVTWREQSAHSAAGILGDGASHLFDALAYALAPVQEVCGHMMIVPRPAGIPQPDSIDLATCLARLRLPSGQASGFADRETGAVHVTVLTSRLTQPYSDVDGMQVMGTGGSLSIPLTRGQHEHIHMLRSGQRQWEDVPLPADANTGESLACTRMLGAFIEAVLRGRLDPEQDPSFAAGLHAQQAIDAGLRSAQSGRWERV
jgi:predicted dehydrogenase